MADIITAADGNSCLSFGYGDEKYRLLASRDPEAADTIHFGLYAEGDQDAAFMEMDMPLEDGATIAEAFRDALEKSQNEIIRHIGGLRDGSQELAASRHLFFLLGEQASEIAAKIAAERITCVRFTFEDDPLYPYAQGQYVEAYGKDLADCVDAFRKAHENRPGSDAVNCAGYHLPASWELLREKCYKDRKPEQVLVSDRLYKPLYGRKPEGYGPVCIFVPEKDALVIIRKGDPDKILMEDLGDDGKDCVDYDAYEIKDGQRVEEGDGSIIPIQNTIEEHYPRLADAIPDVLDGLYGDRSLNAVILPLRSRP